MHADISTKAMDYFLDSGNINYFELTFLYCVEAESLMLILKKAVLGVFGSYYQYNHINSAGFYIHFRYPQLKQFWLKYVKFDYFPSGVPRSYLAHFKFLS